MLATTARSVAAFLLSLRGSSRFATPNESGIYKMSMSFECVKFQTFYYSVSYTHNLSVCLVTKYSLHAFCFIINYHLTLFWSYPIFKVLFPFLFKPTIMTRCCCWHLTLTKEWAKVQCNAKHSNVASWLSLWTLFTSCDIALRHRWNVYHAVPSLVANLHILTNTYTHLRIYLLLCSLLVWSLLLPMGSIVLLCVSLVLR